MGFHPSIGRRKKITKLYSISFINGRVKAEYERVDRKRDNEEKRTILHWAVLCHQSSSTISTLLTQNASIINEETESGDSALLIAAEKGQAEIVDLLIWHGAFINAHNTSSGATALLLAVEHGHKDVVDVLLEHGAKRNISRYHDRFEGDAPIHAAEVV